MGSQLSTASAGHSHGRSTAAAATPAMGSQLLATALLAQSGHPPSVRPCVALLAQSGHPPSIRPCVALLAQSGHPPSVRPCVALAWAAALGGRPAGLDGVWGGVRAQLLNRGCSGPAGCAPHPEVA